jgi:hypothetical protein
MFRRSAEREAPDALTPFEIACTVSSLKPGVDRLDAFFELPEQLKQQIFDAALSRVRRRRAGGCVAPPQ